MTLVSVTYNIQLLETILFHFRSSGNFIANFVTRTLNWHIFNLFSENFAYFKDIIVLITNTTFSIVFYQGDDPLNEKVMTVFASGKSGRLMGRGILFKQYDKISTPGQCASYCNQYKVTKCLSFNYDFSSLNCELLEAIEGHEFKLSTVKSKLIFIFFCILCISGRSTIKFSHFLYFVGRSLHTL